MDIFLAWEKLRLFYNLVLVGVVWSHVIASGSGPDFSFWHRIGLAAIQANVEFCVGPVAEGYLCILGFDRRKVRWLLFFGGLLLSVLGALNFLSKLGPGLATEPGGGFLS